MKRITENLSEHTWIKIGGPAEITIPETKEELVTVLKECQNEQEYRLLGNGSNLLAADQGIDELVIKNTEACTEIKSDSNRVNIGASVMVPQFISECIKQDLGGYEYLYSVPGTIGGAIYMNAGRGPSHNKTIADYLTSVEIFDGENTRIIAATDLDFEYRYSSFQDRPEWVVLSATFELPNQPSEIGQEKAQERMKKVNERERAKPNAGSVFKTGARLPLHKIPPNGLAVGDARFVAKNRICNDGDASFTDVLRLIDRAKRLNRITPPFGTPELEWEIWK